MEKLRPKLYSAMLVGLLYDSPRAYLNVHTFGSFCALHYNVIKGEYFAREPEMLTFTPKQRQIFEDKLLPPYLVDYINSEKQFELTYELQHTSIAMPFQHYSPKCAFHLDKMRGSLVFQIYFVMCDCIFLIIIISLIVYSTVYFFLELKKGVEFREKNSSARGNKLRFWTLPRISFLSTSLLVTAVLVAQILFTIYWLIVDFDGVFLIIEIIRYIQLFHFYSLTFYLTALSHVKLLQLNVLNK